MIRQAVKLAELSERVSHADSDITAVARSVRGKGEYLKIL